MSRVQPRTGYGLPRPALGTSKSGTDWLLISSLTITFGVVLFVLCSVIVPRAIARAQYARMTAAHQDLRALASAVRNFRLDCDRYPSTDEGLGALLHAPIDSHGWNGPYVAAIPLDPWHHPYQIQIPGPSGSGFELRSSGPGKLPGDAEAEGPIVLDEDDR